MILPNDNNVQRKVLTVIGCCLIQLVIGTYICTGNIIPYVASYISEKDGSVTNESMSIVFYLCVLSWSVGFNCSSYFTTKFSLKKCIYFGITLFITVIYISAAIQQKNTFIAIYGVFLGVGTGISYSPTLMIAINNFPEKKGLISGIILSCFAIGSFIFNFVALAIVNPDNAEASLEKTINGKIDKFFHEEIANNVPKMFLILASIYAVLAVLGLVLIEDISLKPVTVPDKIEKDENYKETEEADKVQINISRDEQCEEKPEALFNEGPTAEIKIEDNKTVVRSKTIIANPDLNLTLIQCLQTRQFHQIFFGILLSGPAGLFATASFKTVGLNNSFDDQFLTVVGSVGSILSGLSRPFWGLSLDKLGPKLTLFILLAIQILSSSTFPLISLNKPCFLIWISVLNCCSGGLFTMLTPIAVRIYGRATGIKVCGLFAFAMGLASLSNYFIQTFATLYLGYNAFFYILAGLNGCIFISNLFFDEVISTK